jgi:hypothetical protein
MIDAQKNKSLSVTFICPECESKNTQVGLNAWYCLDCGAHFDVDEIWDEAQE